VETKIIIDATEGVMGRIAAFAAKQSLLGKTIVIVNCEEAIITGPPRVIVAKYLKNRARGGTAQRGPYFPKGPERIMKRTIRGMLSHAQKRGKDALGRIMCYDAVPDEFKDKEKLSMVREIKTKFMTLKRLSQEL
jgi:large subunit ribosomal protein L13